MIFLSSSSFFLSDYLTKQLGKNNYRSGQLSYGLKHDHIAALTIKEKSAGFDSRNWLALNQKLGKSQANTALKLGHWYQKKFQQESNTALINTAVMWFEQAIRLGSQQAAIALAQLYFKDDKLLKALLAIDTNNDIDKYAKLLSLLNLMIIDHSKNLLSSSNYSIEKSNKTEGLIRNGRTWEDRKSKT